VLTDLVQLRTFVTVAAEQHLTRAAERLSMSQSAASAHVRAIEERLGTQLFTRTNRNLELTHAGQMLAEKAKTLLREEAIFASFARELKGATEGRLGVGTSSGPGTRIGEVLSTLRKQHPLVTIDLLVRTSSGTRQALLSGEIDVGILLGGSNEASFTYHELARVPYRVAGPAAWADQIRAASWEDLAKLPWLTPNDSSAHASMLGRLFGDKGLRLNTVIRSDNAAVARTALIAGAGMMLIREDHALQGETEGVLALSPLARAEIPMSIAYQASRSTDPLIRAFLEAAGTVWPSLA